MVWDRAVHDEQESDAPLAPVADAAPGDRRTDARAKMSVFRSATLRWRGRETLCLVRNLSPGGLMCRVVAPLAQGERVEVAMRSGHCLTGTVAWGRERQIGIRFDSRIDVAEVLNGPGGGAPVQRMPRLAIGCAATLLGDKGLQSARLLDLSQGGAKIETAALRIDEQVTLNIPGLESHRAAVRWVREGCAGIAFHQPIGFDALARWALERPADQRVGTGSTPE